MQERMKVLEMLEKGKINTDQAVRLLDVLDDSPPQSPHQSPQDLTESSGEEIYKPKK
ncbi:hypothetical protein JXM67_05580 [candidate division WOR-3 bacterium]|nr:hypothetical protein [candidate division WOR-3 bacterium]